MYYNKVFVFIYNNRESLPKTLDTPENIFTKNTL